MREPQRLSTRNHSNPPAAGANGPTALTEIASAFDPNGRRVVLNDRVWDKIRTYHPEMDDRVDLIVAIIAGPTCTTDDPDPDHERERFYGQPPNASYGCSRVIVEWYNGHGEIVTAFGQSSPPPC